MLGLPLIWFLLGLFVGWVIWHDGGLYWGGADLPDTVPDDWKEG